MSERLDWIRFTPPLKVEWEVEVVYLQAMHEDDEVCLISFGARGELKRVFMADLRVPPGWNGPWGWGTP